jgi:hypothetical protein
MEALALMVLSFRCPSSFDPPLDTMDRQETALSGTSWLSNEVMSSEVTGIREASH